MFPDCESLYRDWLIEQAPPGGAAVVVQVPAARPARMLRVWRSGGFALNRILDQPILTVSAWDADDSAGASALAGWARGRILRSSVSLAPVRRVEEVGAVYYDPDPDTESTRYTFSFSAVLRARS
jgi:hypothetical protein